MNNYEQKLRKLKIKKDIKQVDALQTPKEVFQSLFLLILIYGFGDSLCFSVFLYERGIYYNYFSKYVCPHHLLFGREEISSSPTITEL